MVNAYGGARGGAQGVQAACTLLNGDPSRRALDGGPDLTRRQRGRRQNHVVNPAVRVSCALRSGAIIGVGVSPKNIAPAAWS